MSKNKKHPETVKPNSTPEAKEPVVEVSPPNVDEKQVDVAKLLQDIEQLTITAAQKDEKILMLEKHIEKQNHEYVTKVTEKANEANNMLKAKVDELTKKLNDELMHHKKYAIEKPAVELINIINQFELAVSHPVSDEKIANYQFGFKMFLTMFKKLLNDMNIVEIPIKHGDEFDPVTMECVEFVDDQSLNDNQVSVIVTKGYRLHDRIIQTAVVKVAKRKN
ncbi:protein GrpE [Bacilli bacterium]|nr:protein GrpE [Bacilli bacterium]